MANFKIGENGLDISSFDLPLNRKVRLLQWGGDGQGNKLEVTLNESTTAVDLQVLPDKLAAASTAFTVTGKTSGTTVSVGAYVAGSGLSNKYSEDLKIRVKGAPTRQLGYAVDLLSDLPLHGNAKQIWTYSQIVLGPGTDKHILSQNTKAGQYNCGDVAGAYGTKVFAKPTYTHYGRYYVTPSSDKMADLRFDPKAITSGIAKIKSMLSKGQSVRLWAIHADGFAKSITGDWRTHYLTVIGYATNKLLYLDPWPTGSKLAYDGGMYSKTTIAFMGELTFDLGKPAEGLISPVGASGAHKYRIIGGP